MKSFSRREALWTLAGASSVLVLDRATARPAADNWLRAPMGIVTYALGIHQKNQWAGRHEGLAPALALLEESRRLGAEGIQVDLGPKDAPEAAELRLRAERYQMYVEASFAPPYTEAELERFENNILVAKAAGANLARTVILPGRRYEQFKTLAEFRQHEQRGQLALERAAPILARHGFRLAVENHKDQRIAEKLDTIKHVGSEFIGLCVDLGNNFTLLEDPLATVRAFAPYAFTVHFKDQALQENQNGFWFADAALGEGFLDLPLLARVLRQANPAVRFNLEVITRDPLNVPVLTDDYWVTLSDTPATELARTLKVVKTRAYPKPFTAISRLSPRQQMALELRNVQRSLTFARQHLSQV
jgi:3-oxoisoapionate decarboxylase